MGFFSSSPNPTTADICDVWQPSALKLIDERAKAVAPELARLGPVSPEISPDSVISEVLKRTLATWDTRVESLTVTATPRLPSGLLGSSAWMAAQAALDADFQASVASRTLLRPFFDAAVSSISAAFQGAATGGSTSGPRAQQRAAVGGADALRLARFEVAMAACKSTFSSAFAARSEAEAPTLRAMATHSGAAPAVVGKILSACVWPAFEAIRLMPRGADLLTEDAATAAQRRRLLTIASSATAAREVIAGLRETLGATARVGVSPAPSPRPAAWPQDACRAEPRPEGMATAAGAGGAGSGPAAAAFYDPFV